jgi:hypothetical protein
MRVDPDCITHSVRGHATLVGVADTLPANGGMRRRVRREMRKERASARAVAYPCVKPDGRRQTMRRVSDQTTRLRAPTASGPSCEDGAQVGRAPPRPQVTESGRTVRAMLEVAMPRPQKALNANQMTPPQKAPQNPTIRSTETQAGQRSMPSSSVVHGEAATGSCARTLRRSSVSSPASIEETAETRESIKVRPLSKTVSPGGFPKSSLQHPSVS